MRSTRAINTIQDIFDEEVDREQLKKQKPNEEGPESGLARLHIKETLEKLTQEQLTLLDQYVVINYKYRYCDISKTNKRLAEVNKKWREFLATLKDDNLKQKFNRLRAEYNNYQTQHQNLRSAFGREARTFGRIYFQPVLAQANAASVVASAPLKAEAVAPASREETSSHHSLYKAVINVAQSVKNLVTTRKPEPVLAKAPAVLVSANQGQALAATPIGKAKEETTDSLYEPATKVAKAVKNVVATQKIGSAPSISAVLANQGLASPAKPIAVAKEETTDSLYEPATKVAKAVKNVVATQKVESVPSTSAVLANQGLASPAKPVAVAKEEAKSSLYQPATNVAKAVKGLVSTAPVEKEALEEACVESIYICTILIVQMTNVRMGRAMINIFIAEISIQQNSSARFNLFGETAKKIPEVLVEENRAAFRKH